jgi:replicative DNA helicase
MTVSLEKVFFNYILENKKFFDIVQPYFFKNSEIQFVYKVIRDYMIKGDADRPSPKQILDMVSLEDRDGKITKSILKSVLDVNLNDYSEKDFIEPKFNGWILKNKIKTGTVDIIDETRNFDDNCDFEQACDAAARIQRIVAEMSSTSFIDDDDMGSDFDDPEAHVQDNSAYKISSGFESIDHMLGGGWDIQTLNVIMAETSNGKCFFGNGEISIRNKNDKSTKSVKIGKMFSKISNGDTNI